MLYNFIELKNEISKSYSAAAKLIQIQLSITFELQNKFF